MYNAAPGVFFTGADMVFNTIVIIFFIIVIVISFISVIFVIITMSIIIMTIVLMETKVRNLMLAPIMNKSLEEQENFYRQCNAMIKLIFWWVVG